MLLEIFYSDYWPHLYCYNHNVLTDMSFFRCFILNSWIHKESFIWITGVDCPKSINQDWVQVLNYCKYPLLVLPVVGIEPATSKWFHLKNMFQSNALSTTLCVSDNTEWTFGIYKPNVSITILKRCDYKNKNEIDSLRIFFIFYVTWTVRRYSTLKVWLKATML